MKQITLEEIEGKTIQESLWTRGALVFVFNDSSSLCLCPEGGDVCNTRVDIAKFNIKDMLRLGFVTQDQLDAAERARSKEEETAEYTEYKRLRDKFGDKFICGECDLIHTGGLVGCPQCGTVATCAACS